MDVAMAEIEVAKTIADEITEFIDQKWKNQKCEVCETDSWEIYPEQTNFAYLPLGGESGPPQMLPPPSAPFVHVSCQNCGNLRLISKRALDRWREEQGTKAQKSSS
jgi:hypothetical protein